MTGLKTAAKVQILWYLVTWLDLIVRHSTTFNLIIQHDVSLQRNLSAVVNNILDINI